MKPLEFISKLGLSRFKIYGALALLAVVAALYAYINLLRLNVSLATQKASAAIEQRDKAVAALKEERKRIKEGAESELALQKQRQARQLKRQRQQLAARKLSSENQQVKDYENSPVPKAIAELRCRTVDCRLRRIRQAEAGSKRLPTPAVTD